MEIDEAKQILYVEEVRAYRNAFKMDKLPNAAIEYEITYQRSQDAPKTPENEFISHGSFSNPETEFAMDTAGMPKEGFQGA